VRDDWNNPDYRNGEGQASNAFLPHSCFWMELGLLREHGFRGYFRPWS
jgi:hypothetical protein